MENIHQPPTEAEGQAAQLSAEISQLASENPGNSDFLPQRTFTQQELDKILNERLSRERARHVIELKRQQAEFARQSRIADITVRLNEFKFYSPDIASAWATLPENEANQRIEGLKTAISEAVSAIVNERIKAPIPKGQTSVNAQSEVIKRGMGL